MKVWKIWGSKPIRYIRSVLFCITANIYWTPSLCFICIYLRYVLHSTCPNLIHHLPSQTYSISSVSGITVFLITQWVINCVITNAPSPFPCPYTPISTYSAAKSYRFCLHSFSMSILLFSFLLIPVYFRPILPLLATLTILIATARVPPNPIHSGQFSCHRHQWTCQVIVPKSSAVHWLNNIQAQIPVASSSLKQDGYSKLKHHILIAQLPTAERSKPLSVRIYMVPSPHHLQQQMSFHCHVYVTYLQQSQKREKTNKHAFHSTHELLISEWNQGFFSKEELQKGPLDWQQKNFLYTLYWIN